MSADLSFHKAQRWTWTNALGWRIEKRRQFLVYDGHGRYVGRGRTLYGATEVFARAYLGGGVR